MNTLIIDLLAFLANLRVLHWQADTITNEHKVLGDLYETLDGLVDDFAEIHFGKVGKVEFSEKKLPLMPKESIDDHLTVFFAAVSALRDQCKAGVDDDLLNLLADMSAAGNKAKYLLKIQ